MEPDKIQLDTKRNDRVRKKTKLNQANLKYFFSFNCR